MEGIGDDWDLFPLVNAGDSADVEDWSWLDDFLAENGPAVAPEQERGQYPNAVVPPVNHAPAGFNDSSSLNYYPQFDLGNVGYGARIQPAPPTPAGSNDGTSWNHHPQFDFGAMAYGAEMQPAYPTPAGFNDGAALNHYPQFGADNWGFGGDLAGMGLGQNDFWQQQQAPAVPTPQPPNVAVPAGHAIPAAEIFQVANLEPAVPVRQPVLRVEDAPPATKPRRRAPKRQTRPPSPPKARPQKRKAREASEDAPPAAAWPPKSETVRLYEEYNNGSYGRKLIPKPEKE